MIPLKRIAILSCIVILVSFTLAGFAVSADSAAYRVSDQTEERTEQLISERGKKVLASPDTNREEKESTDRSILKGKFKGNGLVLILMFVLWPCILMVNPRWHYLRAFWAQSVHLIRFLCELIIQKEKDGKKKAWIPA